MHVKDVIGTEQNVTL